MLIASYIWLRKLNIVFTSVIQSAGSGLILDLAFKSGENTVKQLVIEVNFESVIRSSRKTKIDKNELILNRQTLRNQTDEFFRYCEVQSLN